MKDLERVSLVELLAAYAALPPGEPKAVPQPPEDASGTVPASAPSI